MTNFGGVDFQFSQKPLPTRILEYERQLIQSLFILISCIFLELGSGLQLVDLFSKLLELLVTLKE